MGKLRNIGIILAIFCISQIIFSGFAFVSPILVINNTGNNAKILPMKKGCQQVINNCTYPIGIPMYPSGATKSFFENKPSCVVVSDCVKTMKCPGTLPVNTIWNTNSNYIQTFDGLKWGPTNKTAHYDTTPTSDDCRYTCAANYIWNGSSCAADTRIYTCPTKPIGTIRNTVSSYPQTWNGTIRTPVDSTTSYSSTASTTSCKYKCDVGYRWDTTSSSCINTCALPWGGGTKVNGETITAYDKTSGTCTTNNCESQTRTCNGILGTFDGSTAYQYASCTPNANTQSCTITNGIGSQSCTAGSTSRGACNVVSCNAGYRASGNTCINTCALPWGGTIANGQSVTAYDKASGTCTTNNCASETRTCNGTLGTLNGTYTYQSCTPNENTQSCTIANGVGSQSCAAGSTSRGTCTLLSCNVGYRASGNTCINTCTLPWGGGTRVNGETIIAYNKTSGICTTDNCSSMPRTCNGTLGTFDGSPIYIYSSCTNSANTQSCAIANGIGNQSCTAGSTSRGTCTLVSCNAGYRASGNTCINTCALPWGGTITDGQSVTAYDKTSGTCTTNNCASETRTCNGTLGTLNGTYTYQSCTNSANTQSCTIANGIGSQSCTAGSTSRGTCTLVSCNAGYRASGNTCINTCVLPWGGGTKVNGETITAYDKTSGTCTTNNCASQTRTCNGTLGTFDGTYQYASCTNSANTQSCTIANGIGNQSCTAGSTSRGTCTLVSCNAGYRASGNTCINTCTLPWGGTITNGQSVTAYDKASGTCITNNCASQSRTCNGTLGTLNGTYTYQSCTNSANTQSCTITNGIGSQSCTAGSTSRGTCILASCNAGYHTEDGVTCISNTKTASCTGKPTLGTIYYTATSITQTWNTSFSAWLPSAVATYSATASTTECRYTCAANYTWNGSSCVYSVCGNDTVEYGETCDGNSTSCSLGGVNGNKRCNNTCNGRGTCYVVACISTYNTDLCAGCYGSWTMSSCDNRECTPDGLEDAIWKCSYAGTTQQCYSVLGDPCNTSTCFTSGTQVKIADGTNKNIENIQIGDELLGQDDQINTVISYDRPNLGERKLYSINNGPYFVTHEHPFMTIGGWKSISPEATRREMPNFEILPLKVGDILIKENNELEYIWSIQSTTADPEIPLYNFKLDGNNTYYANGYLVHNKLYDGDGCTSSSQCACGSCVGGVCCPTGGGGGGGCFKEGTQIRLPDGTTTAIENIQTGNIVLGSENIQNTVLQLFKIWNNWDLYAINNSDYFVTDTHPFMTTDGWKSLNPLGSTKENPGMIFGQLEIGDTLITEQGTAIIYSLEKTSYAGYVYNFRLDGNKTYYADGYLVHNVETKTVQ